MSTKKKKLVPIKIMKQLLAILFLLVLASCNNSDKQSKYKQIEKYPCLFSYKTDSLRKAVYANRIQPLTKEEKEIYFKKESSPNEINSIEFDVYTVNKIDYSSATVVVYLISEIKGSSPFEQDKLAIVIYNKEGSPLDIFSTNLRDPFGTREVNFISPIEFHVIDTDNESSNDPESEAEDIKKGRVPTTEIATSIYQIDTLKFKLNLLHKSSEFIETSGNSESTISLDMQRFCFESIPPSSKKTYLWETIELSIEKDKVKGKGAGNEAEGGPEWVYNFNGILVNDTGLELNINYQVRGVKPFSTTEIWTLSNDREHLRLNKIEPVNLRQQGSGKFYKIDCAEINKNIRERMEKGNFEGE